MHHAKGYMLTALFTRMKDMTIVQARPADERVHPLVGGIRGHHYTAPTG